MGFALVGDLMKRFASTNRVVKDADQKYLMGLTFNKGDPGNVIDKMQNVFNKYPETYGTESSQIEIVRTAVNNSGNLYQTFVCVDSGEDILCMPSLSQRRFLK